MRYSIRYAVVNSQITLPVACVIGSMFWLFGDITHWSRWTGWVVTMVTTVAVMEWNHRATLIRQRNRMASTTFIVLMTIAAFLQDWSPAMLATLCFVIANIKDQPRMQQVFEQYHPQIIYHAAAYKHVPFMEENPYEALLVNVFGTKNIADLAMQYHTEKFVMISTDKAVNPTNVMGATKRMAEIYIQSRCGTDTHFVTTRFGNVLGSNGSVIPLFKKQLSAGGPLTVTHRDIVRYFMTIPEACNLVLEAGAMGGGGDIFVFDMGAPVKIYDLATKMIQLSGLKNIQIKEIGLRPGEKLYEELLATKENTLPTYHPKILRASVRKYAAEEIDTLYQQLRDLMPTFDDMKLVGKMKQIVPEFHSQNSIFAQLDKKENA